MKKLAHRERERGEELARRIQAAGIPIVVESEKAEAPELLIRQDFDAYESMVFDLNGGTGLILPLEIVPTIPAVWFRALEENAGGEWPHYSFYGRLELKFHRSETINRLIAEHSKVRRGHPVQGLLLAYSYDPMPKNIIDEVLHGSIKILDQFECGHVAKISLRAYRQAEPVFKPNPFRRRLFSRPDFKAEGTDEAEE